MSNNNPFGQYSQMSNYGPYTRRYDTDVPVHLKSYSEDQIISFVNERLWGAVQARNFSNMVSTMPQYDRAYKGQFRNNNIPRWRSQLFVRFAFKAVEVLQAYMEDALFGNKPYIYCDSYTPEHSHAAKNMQRLFDYELYHTNFELRMMDLIKFTLKYGTGISKTYWRWYVDYMHEAQFKKNKFGWTERDGYKGKKYLRWDDPWFMPIDPRKVYPDPQARYADECRYVIEEYDTDTDQLIKDKDRYGYFNLERLYDQSPGYTQYGQKTGLTAGYGSDIYPRNEWNGSLDQNRRRVFISEYWGRLDLPGNQDDPRIYCMKIANNRTLIQVQPSSYIHGEIPYNWHNIIPKEEQLYGIGCIEPILTDNYIMNALVNMRVDSMQYFLNPRILVARGALADRRSIEYTRPGEIIDVNAGADIGKVQQQLHITDSGLNSFRDQIEYHARHGEETMALNPNAAGMLSRSKRSATEAAQAMDGANARFNSMIKAFKYTGFDSMIRQYGMLIQQYMGNKRFPILNPITEAERDGHMKLNPIDVQGEMLYRIKDNTVTNKDIRQQLVNNLLGVLAPYAPAFQGQMNMIPLVKELFKMSPVAEKINVDEIFPEQSSPEPRPSILDQESTALENVGTPGIEGQEGMMPPGQPMNQPGLAPQMQAISEQMGGALF